MINQLLVLSVPVAVVFGWLVGHRQRKSHEVEPEPKFPLIPHDYFVGLNYLINEQPDKAVDVFIKMLEVNTDTVETHLALGNLFRRRGEVDRAIRVHQNLIARPQLDKSHRIAALSELAQDYLRLGVLDRAEKLFLELLELDPETSSSLIFLLNIYQQQKDWQQAIITAKRLDSKINPNRDIAISHYYCELTELALQQQQVDVAAEYLKAALDYDKNCARANIIWGKHCYQSGDYKQALRAFKQVREQDAEYLSEIITLMGDCYQQLNLDEEFASYLEKQITDNPRIYFILAMTDYIRRKQGDAAAIAYISQQISPCLSLRGLGRLVDLYINNVDPTMRNKLLLLKEFVGKLSENKPIYRCAHCGFSGKKIYWQCPSCRRWNSVKPIHGLEGD